MLSTRSATRAPSTPGNPLLHLQQKVLVATQGCETEAGSGGTVLLQQAFVGPAALNRATQDKAQTRRRGARAANAAAHEWLLFGNFFSAVAYRTGNVEETNSPPDAAPIQGCMDSKAPCEIGVENGTPSPSPTCCEPQHKFAPTSVPPLIRPRDG